MDMMPRVTSSFRAAAIAVGFAALAALAGAGPAVAAADAAGFVNDLGKRAVDVLTSTGSQAEREQQFKKLFEEGFDIDALSRFVLGPYWRTATPEQQQEFEKLFRDYEVHSYTVRFNEYSGQKLKVTGGRKEGDSAELVQSQIAQPDGSKPPVNVDWRVNKKGSDYKIADVIIDGISMAVTERQQFASVIQRNNGQLDALLKLLRERAGQG
jgi:phospholipid transport system substrate-binding protein